MKLTAPMPVPELLPRTELVERLMEAPEQVCLISAPAGWGKTSVLSAWLVAEAGRRPFAFLRLEAEDNTAPIFWTYVLAALRTVHPGLVADADADEALRSPGMDPMRRVLPALLNALEEVDSRTVLVLDDYHLVDDAGIQTSLAHFIDHLPPSMHVVIATRSDPQLPLDRLRASGGLLEIRSHRLGFSDAETGEFLDRRFGLSLDGSEIRSLQSRTEGWPAALQLVGLSLQDSQDRRAFVTRLSGDDRNLADYLISEVFAGVAADRLEFLLRTSVLDQMTGPLCDAVAGVSDSATTLADLERAGYFLIPLDGQRQWYRYHHLFRDWLRHELKRRHESLIPDLHLRASRWHAEHGSLHAAIAHAIAADRPEMAAGLIDRYLSDWRNAHSSRLWRWLAQLPDDVIRNHPLAAVAQCRFAHCSGDFASASRWIEAAESALSEAPAEARSSIETTTLLYRAYEEALAGDPEAGRTLAEAIAERERHAGSTDYALAVGLVGICTFWMDGPLEAIPLLQEASVARQQASLHDSAVSPLLAAAYAELGDWAAAEETAANTLARSEDAPFLRFPEHMAAHYALGKALVARGERQEGTAQIREGLALAREWVEPVFIAYGCLALAEAVTDYTEKRALVREAGQMIADGRGRGTRITDLVAAAESKLAIRRPAPQTDATMFVEPLTNRELEVLRHLRGDLSLREIGAQLFISYNTVKDHTKSIYRKLGVSSRAAAVETARELDLG